MLNFARQQEISGHMRPIFLIGFMGCGKTTLGKALAKAMDRDFIDLDRYIEGRFHATVTQFFAMRGEEGFRDMERRMLHEVADFEDVVVACGGGTPCHFDNMAHMLSHGLTIHLTTPLPLLVARLKLPGSRQRRPLLSDKTDEELIDYVTGALAVRNPYYTQAELTFDSSRIETAAETAETALILAGIIGPIENPN